MSILLKYAPIENSSVSLLMIEFKKQKCIAYFIENNQMYEEA